MYSLTISLLRFFVLRPSFLMRLSMYSKQGTKLGSQKMTTTNKIASTMQKRFWSKGSCYQGLFAFTTGGHWYFAKLQLTSFPMWLLANSWQLMLKTLSNGYFLMISLDGKRKRDSYSLSGNKGAKIVGAFFENIFIIIPFYWPSLCYLKIGFDVCGNDHIGTSRRDNSGSGTDIADGDGRTDNPE